MTVEQHLGATLPWLLSAIACTIAAATTPGPNNTMVTASGANYGFVRTVPPMAGISLGFPIILTILAIGAARPLTMWPLIHQSMRVAGVVYMCWLAWQIAKAPVGTTDNNQISKDPDGRPFSFLQAISFQFINPKVWIIAASTVATYTIPGGNILMRILALDLIFSIFTPLAVAFWNLVGVGAKILLKTSHAMRTFNYTLWQGY